MRHNPQAAPSSHLKDTALHEAARWIYVAHRVAFIPSKTLKFTPMQGRECVRNMEHPVGRSLSFDRPSPVSRQNRARHAPRTKIDSTQAVSDEKLQRAVQVREGYEFPLQTSCVRIDLPASAVASCAPCKRARLRRERRYNFNMLVCCFFAFPIVDVAAVPSLTLIS